MPTFFPGFQTHGFYLLMQESIRQDTVADDLWRVQAEVTMYLILLLEVWQCEGRMCAHHEGQCDVTLYTPCHAQRIIVAHVECLLYAEREGVVSA